jgi:hypothetical protein
MVQVVKTPGQPQAPGSVQGFRGRRAVLGVAESGGAPRVRTQTGASAPTATRLVPALVTTTHDPGGSARGPAGAPMLRRGPGALTPEGGRRGDAKRQP